VVPARAPTTSALAPAGERVIIATGPSPLFVLLRSAGFLLILIVLAAGVQWTSDHFGLGLGDWPLYTGAALVIVTLVWNALVAQNREYLLTERRVIRGAGVFRRIVTDLPLTSIQHVEVTRLVRERLFGLGSIGFNTAGTAWTEAYWVMVARPAELLATIRATLDHARGVPPPMPEAKIPVIGLAGGIGSGKSAVARAFGSLGAVVIDSDQESRAALGRPEVKRQLAAWWGPGILNPDGTISRKAVAEIVFKNPAERLKLEGLIHPLVKRRRAELVGRAKAAGAPAAVVDAPLLFEANVDQECDAVVFIDAPREVRLKRVSATRGWDEAELTRRESAQLPLDEKQRRSAFTIRNSGSENDLEAEAARVLREVLARLAPGRKPT
jgi:dephospho-CoA kinase